MSELPDPNSTCTVFAVDRTTGEPILFGVVPREVTTAADADGVSLGAASTVTGLLFYRLCGWLLPQNRHAALLDLFQGLPEVQAVIDELQTVLDSGYRPLHFLVADEDLQDQFHDALAASAIALRDSSLCDEMREALWISGTGTSVLPQDWTASPTSSEGIDLSFDGDTATATNNKAMYRWAEVTDATGSRVGWNVLLAREHDSLGLVNVLQPDPLPASTPLTLTVMGGLRDPVGSNSFEHTVPFGMTVSTRIIMPLLSCIIGCPTVEPVETVGDAFDSGEYDTGHPLVDWALTKLVWDPNASAFSGDMPVPEFIQMLSAAMADNSVEVISVLSEWTWEELVPALTPYGNSLARAVDDEFGLSNGTATSARQPSRSSACRSRRATMSANL